MNKRKYRNLPHSIFISALGMDAARWADAFVELNPEYVQAEDVILGWFANCICHAYDAGYYDARNGKRKKL